MPERLYKYLRPDDIRRMAGFEFAPKMMVEGYFAGGHRSRARGSSIEFHEYRPYVQGDDPALIDWRAYARTDRHYLKTFEQETNLEAHLFLDSSASMGFGKPPKLEFASFFTAALAYLVLRHHDRVSLQLFDDQIRSFVEPGSTRRHLHAICSMLETNQAGRPTRLSNALRKAFPLLKRKGTLVVVSDFFDDPGDIFTALSPYLHRGFRVHLFHVLAPEELELEDRGLLTFLDLESGQRLIAHTDNLRVPYRQAMQDHVANLRRLAFRKGIDYALARTDQGYFNLFDHLAR